MTFLDPSADIEIKSGGNLPHWHQDGKIQYVTFRLSDSLPQSKINELHTEIEKFKSLHPEPWNIETKRKYWEIIGPLEERIIDNGYGSCILKNPDIREIIINALIFRNSIDYQIIAFVIMPNHVHLLIQLKGDKRLSDILHSIKRFTAREINKVLCRKGQLWMNESFDRLVRSTQHLTHYVEYIVSNPRYIEEGEYHLYVDNEFVSWLVN